MFNFIRKYWKSICVVLIILYLSFAPPSEFKKIPPIKIEFFDKFVHVALYAFFSIILFVDLRKSLGDKATKTIFFIWSFLFPVMLGGFIEIAQENWFSPRTAEWIDWFADILGV